MQYEDIAILTKKNADVLALAGYLHQVGIPEDHMTAEMSALSHPVVLLFIALIRACTDLSQDSPLARVLFLPGIPMSLMERMQLLAVARAGKPLIKILVEHGTSEMRAWVEHLKKLAEERAATPVVEWPARLAFDSGFLASVLALGEREDA